MTGCGSQPMKPKCTYPNTQSASNAVERWLARNEPSLELTLRPYNRFEPVNTDWWLIPSTDWPAYSYGKFFFSTSNKERALCCGFYVEKGLDPAVAAAFPTGRQLVMDSLWSWHTVLKGMKLGPIGDTVAEVWQRSGRPAEVMIDGGFVDDPGTYDPYAPPMGWSHVAFESRGGVLEPTEPKVDGDPLAHFHDCRSLAELADAVRQVPQIEWTWMNLHFGQRFELAPLAPGDEPARNGWQAEDLWHKVLEPFAPWLRNASEEEG